LAEFMPAPAVMWTEFTPEIVQAVKQYEAQLAPAPEVIEPQVAVGPEVPLVAPVPVSPEVVHYVLKVTPPDELIRYYFRDLPPPTIERMLYIACREGGMGKDRVNPKRNPCAPQNRVPAVPFDPSCGADNPTSSASGLFQFIDDWAGWGGYDWKGIVSRDCLTDVQMARAVFANSGFGPWEL